jgi:hypothetical protein
MHETEIMGALELFRKVKYPEVFVRLYVIGKGDDYHLCKYGLGDNSPPEVSIIF